MPRIRTIKPGIWQDDRFGGLSLLARLLFIGLITQADDAGRFRASVALARSSIFPHDDEALTRVQIEAAFQELSTAGLVRLYEVRGERFGWLPSWERHQRLDRRWESELPEPPDDGAGTDPGADPERAGSDPGRNGMEWNGTERKKHLARSPSDSDPPAPGFEPFSVIGRGARKWSLPVQLLADLRDAFPGLDVERQIRRARGWCETHPAKRKTARGMPAFLWTWMRNEVDGGPRGPRSGGPSGLAARTEGDVDASIERWPQ